MSYKQRGVKKDDTTSVDDIDNETRPFLASSSSPNNDNSVSQPSSNVIQMPSDSTQPSASTSSTTAPPSKASQYQSKASVGVKLFFLVSILLQNSGYTLVRRYDRAILLDTASNSSILITNEFMKLTVSLIMGIYTYFTQIPSISSAPNNNHPSNGNVNGNGNGNGGGGIISSTPAPKRSICDYFYKLISSSPKLFVPSVLYLLQGWVSFLAVARVDACTYTAITQCKLVTTAVAGYFFLQRRFTQIQVISLAHLVCGVIIIVFVTFTSMKSAHDAREAAAAAAANNNNNNNNNNDDNKIEEQIEFGAKFMLGVLCAFIETSLSGVTVVFVEKVFKDDKKNLSVWDRNVQLSVFSIAIWIYFFAKDGFYDGWSTVTVIISCFGSVGGILVAFSVKYADSVLKTMAVSGSVVFTSLMSSLLLDGPYNVPIAAASVSVVIAVISYVTKGNFGEVLKICRSGK